MCDVVLLFGYEVRTIWLLIGAFFLGQLLANVNYAIDWLWPKAKNHEYNVRVARDDTGEGFVVTCDNKCHLDGSRAELVGRYVVVEGGLQAKNVEQRWLWS